MSRDWLAAYCGILGKPKYRRLSIPARAALFHVWLLAGQQAPEATWPDRDTLADALDLDGYPADALDELVTRHWLDVDGEGRIVVHDWDDWQLAASRSARAEYERDRKRAWRRNHRADDADAAPLSPAPLSPDSDKTGTQQDKTVQVSPIVRDTSGTPKGQTPSKSPDEPLKERTNGVAPSVEQLTCPGCGDLLDDTDANIAKDRHGQRWHVACPSAPSVSGDTRRHVASSTPGLLA